MPPARRPAPHASCAPSPAQRCRSSRWTAAPASGRARRPGLPGPRHPASCTPLPAARDGPLTGGAAARRAHLGDQLIICTYAPMSDEEIKTYKPKIILVDEKNGIKEIKKV